MWDVKKLVSTRGMIPLLSLYDLVLGLTLSRCYRLFILLIHEYSSRGYVQFIFGLWSWEHAAVVATIWPAANLESRVEFKAKVGCLAWARRYQQKLNSIQETVTRQPGSLSRFLLAYFLLFYLFIYLFTYLFHFLLTYLSVDLYIYLFISK